MNTLNTVSIAALGATLVAFGVATSAKASVLFNPSTGHYYEFVSGSYTWSEAKAAAETRSYQGLVGYLATITSQAENDFIASNFDIIHWGGWIGASDAETEQVWKWVTGPEAGTVFWDNGTVFGYHNFSPGEPNNSIHSNEDYAHIWSWGVYGSWNDLPDDATVWNWIAPIEANSIGYFVEYGGIKSESEPQSIPEYSSVWSLLIFGLFSGSLLLKQKVQNLVKNSRSNR